MQFPFSVELLRRLPRHPDWKYEPIEGAAWLPPRPKPLGFLRPTDLPVTGGLATGNVEIRALEPSTDLSGVERLLHEVWQNEDPFRSFDVNERTAELGREIARSTEDEAVEGAVAVDARGICGCVLTTRANAVPVLTSLTVRGDARGQGLATGLLGVVVERLAKRGIREIASSASAANLPSLRWHLARGFTVTLDPLYELQRGRDPHPTEGTA